MRYLTIFAIALASATPVMGGSIDPDPAIPTTTVKSTQGLSAAGSDWTGAYIGGQLGFGDFDATGGGLNTSDDGLVGGIHGGYNWDIGPYVVGVEADIDGADISLGAGDLDSITRLKVRGGPDLGRTFLYGTVGAAFADGTAGGVNFSDWGYVIGLGIDYQLQDQWVIGGDVLYHEIKDITPAGADLEGTVVRLRASYRF